METNENFDTMENVENNSNSPQKKGKYPITFSYL